MRRLDAIASFLVCRGVGAVREDLTDCFRLDTDAVMP